MSTARTSAEHNAWVQGYCDRLGNPRATEAERKRIATAAGYYEKNYKELFPAKAGTGEEARQQAITQEMKGIDFKKPVRERQLKPGESLGRYEYLDQVKRPDPNRPSRFFGPTGNDPSRSGISDEGRVYQRFTAKRETTVLESRAASTNDTWTLSRGREPLKKDASLAEKAARRKEVSRPVQGRGKQYVVTPSQQKNLELTYQQIKREPRPNRHDRASAQRAGRQQGAAKKSAEQKAAAPSHLPAKPGPAKTAPSKKAPSKAVTVPPSRGGRRR